MEVIEGGASCAAYCTNYAAYCTNCAAYCTSRAVYCTNCAAHCTNCEAPCTNCAAHCTSCAAHCTSCAAFLHKLCETTTSNKEDYVQNIARMFYIVDPVETSFKDLGSLPKTGYIQQVIIPLV